MPCAEFPDACADCSDAFFHVLMQAEILNGRAAMLGLFALAALEWQAGGMAFF